MNLAEWIPSDSVYNIQFLPRKPSVPKWQTKLETSWYFLRFFSSFPRPLPLSNCSCLFTKHDFITVGFSSSTMHAFSAHNKSVVTSIVYNVSQIGHLRENGCMNTSLSFPVFSSFRYSSSNKGIRKLIDSDFKEWQEFFSHRWMFLGF